MPFDIRQLRYAIAAADHGSFYRAARVLGVEQSTLSRNILKLERVVNGEIFNRSRAGVTTTIAGTHFIHSARAMIASADKMVRAMRAAGQGRAGGLTVGHNNAISAGHLRATMLGWRNAHPDVELDGVEAGRSALFAGLDTGEIDIAILVGDASFDGFRHEALWSERVMVALPAHHPLADHNPLYWTDLRRERFLLPAADPGPEIRDMLTGRLSVAGVQPDVRMHHVSREGILSTLGGGIGLSIICEGGTGARYPDVVYRPVHGEQGAALIVFSGYWRTDNGNPALRRFLAFVRDRYALAFDIP
ncbi:MULTISPECIES: LysR family transcriptional regulator [Sphingobium]|nr:MULTISPECIES: LysR family transcriptional regulator [Sphingobium]WDA38408.1 LysR substrate-binding domain-containing protein [Sphingobium sp. YC-XJ3]SCW79362.1 DNA-binding transcriptional regulator, LysR family [Sphingobium faniae]